MKKRIVALLLAVLMIFSVSACKKDDGDTSSQVSKKVTSRNNNMPGLIEPSSKDPDSGEASGTETPSGTGSKSEGGSKPVVEVAPAKKTYSFAVPALTGDKTSVLNNNPNRGFRLENYMNVDNGKYTPDLYDGNGNYRDNGAMTAVSRMMGFYNDYDYESAHIVQTYFYLTRYRDKDLDAKAFQYMNEYFEACRSMNVTVALRFAYVFDFDHNGYKDDCVSLQQMLRHIDQLKSILAKNRDVLFCVEGGFFGEWGEQSQGSPWYVNGQSGTIMDALVKAVPSDVWVVVRYYDIYATCSPETQKRLGFHNDYICGFSHQWDTGNRWDTDRYAATNKLSATCLFEGEMPWGGQLPNNLKNLNGWNVVKYLFNNHYTVLSCYHNNREGGAEYDMKKWRKVSVTADSLKSNGLRYYDAWFKTAKGGMVARSLFDYLKQHLGYLLMASDVTVKKENTKATVSLKMTNYGFAAPLAMQSVKIVAVDAAGKVVAEKKACEVGDLQAGTTKTLAATLTLPNSTTVYRIGFALTAPNGVGAHLANDVAFENGINILGKMN